MRRSDFHYDLPDALIARYPPAQRSGGRLLHLDGRSGDFQDRNVVDLPGLLRPGDLLVFNDTRVVPARLFGAKETGGRVEILLERLLGGSRALVQLRSGKPARPGTQVRLPDGDTADRRNARLGSLEGALHHLGWIHEFDASTQEPSERQGGTSL